MTVLARGCFQRSGLRVALLPEGLAELGESCFRGTRLSKVRFPRSVRRVGDYAFADCAFLGEANFAEGSELRSLGLCAFKNTALTEFCAPEHLERISQGAFYACRRLVSVSLNEEIRELGSEVSESVA